MKKTTLHITNGSILTTGATGAWASSNTAVATVNATTGVITGLTAGTATITYTITGGCGGTAVASRQITVIEQPTITLQPSLTNQGYCLNTTAGLLNAAASNATSYQWFSTNTATPFGNALNFDGTNDYVDLSNSSLLNFQSSQAFTLETWIKRRTNGGGVLLSRFNATISGQYFLTVSTDGFVTFQREVSPFNLVSTSAIPANEWHHVAATYDGSSKLANDLAYAKSYRMYRDNQSSHRQLGFTIVINESEVHCPF